MLFRRLSIISILAEIKKQYSVIDRFKGISIPLYCKGLLCFVTIPCRVGRGSFNFQCLSGMGVFSIVQILGRGLNVPVWKGVDKLPFPRIGVP